MATCSVEGCDKPVDARGWCKKHVTRWYRTGDPLAKKPRPPSKSASVEELKARFRTKFDIRGECWIWRPGKNRYGSYHVGKHFEGRRLKPAHQASYLLHVGPTNGLHVLHKCDNDRCVNPEHLYLGTHQDNMKDRKDRGRSYRASGEANAAAKLTATNVIEMRQLRECGLTYTEIGRRFGVEKSTARRNCLGDSWSHIR